MSVAVRELTTSFQKDTEALLKGQLKLDLLSNEAKLLVIVYAVSLLRNILIRTFKVSEPVMKTNLRRVFDSLNALIGETKINLPELVKESRRTLSRFEREGASGNEQQQLQHVDMLFRFYLPLYSLLR